MNILRGMHSMIHLNNACSAITRLDEAGAPYFDKPFSGHLRLARFIMPSATISAKTPEVLSENVQKRGISGCSVYAHHT